MVPRVKPIILVGDQPVADFFIMKNCKHLEDKKIDTHVLKDLVNILPYTSFLFFVKSILK